MEKQNVQKEIVAPEKTGEDLLQEYFNQDKDDKHYMGYSVYSQTQTSSDGCCC